MSTTEAILEKVSTLPPEKQEQVLEFVQSRSRATVPAAKAGEPYAWLKLADTIPLGWSPRAAGNGPPAFGVRTSGFGFPSDFGLLPITPMRVFEASLEASHRAVAQGWRLLFPRLN